MKRHLLRVLTVRVTGMQVKVRNRDKLRKTATLSSGTVIVSCHPATHTHTHIHTHTHTPTHTHIVQQSTSHRLVHPSNYQSISNSSTFWWHNEMKLQNVLQVCAEHFCVILQHHATNTLPLVVAQIAYLLLNGVIANNNNNKK